MAVASKRIAATVAMSKRLWRWLPVALSDDEAQGIVVHLADLYGASAKLRELVAGLPRIDPRDRAAVRRALLAVHTELYDHMWVHMTELRGALHDGIDGLYEQTKPRRRISAARGRS